MNGSEIGVKPVTGWAAGCVSEWAREAGRPTGLLPCSLARPPTTTFYHTTPLAFPDTLSGVESDGTQHLPDIRQLHNPIVYTANRCR